MKIGLIVVLVVLQTLLRMWHISTPPKTTPKFVNGNHGIFKHGLMR